MRLDKLLCQLNMGSRSEVKKMIRSGLVTVNGVPATSPEHKIAEETDRIVCRGQLLNYRSHVYYMMNKPCGVVSATRDREEKTVLDLLLPGLPEWEQKREIVPVGRLDKDTEGLLLLTDDGELVHALLSPKRHVDKTYLVKTAKPLAREAAALLEQGVDIGEKQPTLPARVKILDPAHILLTIHEGKFHQVKRMLRAVDNEVLTLKRLSFGALHLDEELAPGKFRSLTEEEIAGLKPKMPQNAPGMTGIDMSDIDAVIFDLDGTLVDSMWLWRQIDIEYLGRFGLELPEKLQAEIEGKSFHETAVYFKERFGIEDSVECIKDNWNTMAWEKYEREVPLKNGARDFLTQCRSRGIRLGIATSNSRELTENVIRVHGLQGCFDCIKTGGDVQKGKPAPDVYLSVADSLQVQPERCLVFEDILPGIMAGRNAGMKVCAVEDEYSADMRTQKRKLADYYINDYTELLR